MKIKNVIFKICTPLKVIYWVVFCQFIFVSPGLAEDSHNLILQDMVTNAYDFSTSENRGRLIIFYRPYVVATGIPLFEMKIDERPSLLLLQRTARRKNDNQSTLNILLDAGPHTLRGQIRALMNKLNKDVSQCDPFSFTIKPQKTLVLRIGGSSIKDSMNKVEVLS